MTGGNIKEMAGEVARHEKLHPIDFGGHKRVMKPGSLPTRIELSNRCID